MIETAENLEVQMWEGRMPAELGLPGRIESAAGCRFYDESTRVGQLYHCFGTTTWGTRRVRFSAR